MGGLYTFKFIPASDVASIPEAVNGAIYYPVVLKPDARWFDGYCTQETMSFSDRQQDDGHGAYHKKQFAGNVPKDRPELSNVFNDLKDGRYILDIIDNNGTRKLVGTIDEPLDFSSDVDSKAAVSARNEYKIMFAGDGIKKSPGYLNA